MGRGGGVGSVHTLPFKNKHWLSTYICVHSCITGNIVVQLCYPSSFCHQLIHLFAFATRITVSIESLSFFYHVYDLLNTFPNVSSVLDNGHVHNFCRAQFSNIIQDGSAHACPAVLHVQPYCMSSRIACPTVQPQVGSGNW